jgi:hypothetical protein
MGETRPFYWTNPYKSPHALSAPDGWWQWTEEGLVYLGESILDQK